MPRGPGLLADCGRGERREFSLQFHAMRPEAPQRGGAFWLSGCVCQAPRHLRRHRLFGTGKNLSKVLRHHVVGMFITRGSRSTTTIITYVVCRRMYASRRYKNMAPAVCNAIQIPIICFEPCFWTIVQDNNFFMFVLSTTSGAATSACRRSISRWWTAIRTTGPATRFRLLDITFATGATRTESLSRHRAPRAQ